MHNEIEPNRSSTSQPANKGHSSVKSARNWRGSSDSTSSIPSIVAACAISTSTARGPGSTVMQNRDTNLESRFDCHSSANEEGVSEQGWLRRNRIEANRCFAPCFLRCKCIRPFFSPFFGLPPPLLLSHARVIGFSSSPEVSAHMPLASKGRQGPATAVKRGGCDIRI